MRSALLFGSLLVTSACAPNAYERCRDVELGAPLSSLPVTEDVPRLGYGFPEKGPVRDLQCCFLAGPDAGNLCAVDCADPVNQANPVRLGGEFTGECGAAWPGISHCTVWERNGLVVATNYFCED